MEFLGLVGRLPRAARFWYGDGLGQGRGSRSPGRSLTVPGMAVFGGHVFWERQWQGEMEGVDGGKGDDDFSLCVGMRWRLVE